MMFCTASGFAGYVLNRPRLAFIVVTAMSQIYGVLMSKETYLEAKKPALSSLPCPKYLVWLCGTTSGHS